MLVNIETTEPILRAMMQRAVEINNVSRSVEDSDILDFLDRIYWEMFVPASEDGTKIPYEEFGNWYPVDTGKYPDDLVVAE